MANKDNQSTYHHETQLVYSSNVHEDHVCQGRIKTSSRIPVLHFIFDIYQNMSLGATVYKPYFIFSLFCILFTFGRYLSEVQSLLIQNKMTLELVLLSISFQVSPLLWLSAYFKHQSSLIIYCSGPQPLLRGQQVLPEIIKLIKSSFEDGFKICSELVLFSCT